MKDQKYKLIRALKITAYTSICQLFVVTKIAIEAQEEVKLWYCE